MALVMVLALTALTSCGATGNGSSGDKAAAGDRAAAGGRSGTTGNASSGKGGSSSGERTRQRTQNLERLPDVGPALHRRIPAQSRQVLVVRGEGEDSAKSTVFLYEKRENHEDPKNHEGVKNRKNHHNHRATWDRTRSWPAHNGKRGWTTDHREGDKRSPVGVFTLSDAGGVLAAPDARLPYTHSPAFQASRTWPKRYWHDFDHVIAIDYNRVRGTSPNDPNRPQGQSKGGYIWLHLDHGSGTSGCVSVSKSAMQYLLRELDPKAHPVIVMGDKGNLGSA
ncbi:L,D-transpeptidase family protein [Streptomyces sp. B-S-A8]|uniref:L,D-transpeptidase family protein n=1 Tax=Streptomyces solicavernae TaxID=3043614 RepID=A0ABT6RU21_9ACTN|nr:L,D-transpeptidase family protein [Streptomyces sp. B-S-A8]MDI3387934.1 L,D-transpeptidase family protein [Streptomyces sp. B-S-A8]